MTIVLVLPAAGLGSRINLPYPKEALSLGPWGLLIDSALNVGRTAGAAKAVVVVSDRKLKPLASIVGPRRCGLELRYVDIAARGKSHSPTDAGSIIRGASLALSAMGASRVIVAYPDCLYGNDDVEHFNGALLKLIDEAPGDAMALHPGSKSPLAVFGQTGYRRLARLEQSMARSTTFLQMLEADAANWKRHDAIGWIEDVDTWADARRVMRITEEDTNA